MKIGDRIKKIREEKGILQLELAEIIKCSKQTLYKYENNIITNIPSDKIELISKALNCSPGYLMGWDDSISSDFGKKDAGLLIKYSQLSDHNKNIVSTLIDSLLDGQK